MATNEKQIDEARARDQMDHEREYNDGAICTGENFSHLLHRYGVAIEAVELRSFLFKEAAQPGKASNDVDDCGEQHDGVKRRDARVQADGQVRTFDVFKFYKGFPKIDDAHRADRRAVKERQESRNRQKYRRYQIEDPYEFSLGMRFCNAFFQCFGLFFFYAVFHFIASSNDAGILTSVLLRWEYRNVADVVP